MPIESPCGAFIVGFETGGPAHVRAIDAEGRAVLNRDGVPEVLEVDDFLAEDPPPIPPGIWKASARREPSDG